VPPESRRRGSTRPSAEDLLGFDTREAGGSLLPAGIDEAGRGPLAGPLVACCVVLTPGLAIPGLDDSKALTPRARLEVRERILEGCLGFGIGLVEPREIDSLGMTRSVALSFERAAASCTAADVYLIDGRPVEGLPFNVRFFVRGDSRSRSIAAASILAKVHRDSLMAEADRVWPGYGFADNSGYGTPAHLAALRELGPCPIHRFSFAPVAETVDLFGGLHGG